MKHLPPLLVLLGCAACTFDIKIDLPESAMPGDGEDGGPGEARDAGAEHDASSDQGPSFPSDASSDGLGGTTHPACTVPRGNSLPPIVGVNGDATGRPAFDFWRDLACESVADYPTCQVPRSSTLLGDWPCYTCSYGLSGDGICSAGNSTRCDMAGNELLTLRDGQCHLCAPVEAKARACCEGLPSFDCRAWPYPANSKPGEGCARHEDCEPGLVCHVRDHDGYGLCLCPDATFPAEVGGNACGSST